MGRPDGSTDRADRCWVGQLAADLSTLASNLVSLPLQLSLQFSLKGLHIGRAGLITLLRGIEHQTTLLVEGPFAGDAVAECHRPAHHGTRAHDAINFEG